MEFCVKMKPYLAHYSDRIQVPVNSYLCFPTASEKERKEKKTNDVDVGQNFVLKWIFQPNPLIMIFYLPFLRNQIM